MYKVLIDSEEIKRHIRKVCDIYQLTIKTTSLIKEDCIPHINSNVEGKLNQKIGNQNKRY